MAAKNYGGPGGPRIVVEQGDLLQAPVKYIVNAANAWLAHGGGLARAIAKAAGERLVIESEAKATLPVGAAAATTAGDLPYRAVIHAVGPQWGGGRYQENELLHAAVSNAIRCADMLGQAYFEDATVALPAISCGIFGFPVERAAPIALRAARAVTTSRVTDIRFVLASDEHHIVFTEAAERLTR